MVGKGIWQFPLRHISEEEEERIRTEMESGGCGGRQIEKGRRKKFRRKGPFRL